MGVTNGLYDNIHHEVTEISHLSEIFLYNLNQGCDFFNISGLKAATNQPGNSGFTGCKKTDLLICIFYIYLQLCITNMYNKKNIYTRDRTLYPIW